MQKYGTLSLFENNQHLIPQHFINTDLGQLYQAIPFEDLASGIPSPKGERNGRGRKNLLSVKGGLALMFLKHYLCLSDEMLIDRLNTDWSMQYFCGINLGTKMIRNKNLVSDWRSYLSRYADIPRMQEIFASYWKPLLKDKHVGMSDATVYESYIRHPNDVVLLWQSCEFIYEALCTHCKEQQLRKPRIKFEKKCQAVLSYQRTRKKSRRRSAQLRKRLTKFLHRLMARFNELQVEVENQERLKTIRTLLRQQYWRLQHPDEKINNRIVNLYKPYVRPIVRGKETKSVEFGAKVNLLHVDGINFIEHLSFDAFNEGIRLIPTIRLHRTLFGACHQFGADQIYATNKNRKYCSKNNIATCFVPKGKQGPNKEQSQLLRKEIGKQRATVLEGSFGNEKNHYLLQKVKARNQANEITWIFFGIMTCNATLMSKRMQTVKSRPLAA
jgi:transposase, IS5 family